MAIAIVLGLLTGAVGFIPLLIGLRLTRRVTATSNFGYMSILILCLIASFGMLVVFAGICLYVNRELAAPFVFSEAVGLSVFAIAYGIANMLRRK